MKYIFAHKESNVVFLTISLNHEWFSHPYLTNLFGIPMLKEAWLSFSKGYIEWYPERSSWDKACNIVTNKIKNPRFAKNIFLESIKQGEIVRELGDVVYKALIKDEDLSKIEEPFEIYLEEMFRLSSLGLAPVISDLEHNRLTNSLERIINTKISKYALKRTAGEYFSILTIHTKKTKIYEFRKRLLDLSHYLDEKKLQETVKQFCWIEFGHTGPVYNKKRLLSYLQEIKRDKGERKKLVQQINYRKIERKQRKLLAELKLSFTEKFLFETAKYFSAVKQYRAEFMFFTFFLVDLALSKLATQSGLAKQYLRMMTKYEFLKALKTGKTPPIRVLKQREELCVCIVHNFGRLEILSGKEAKKFIFKNRTKQEIKEVSELKGSVASPGKVQGFIKIVNVPSQMKKIRKGDILVAEQTIPQLLPAMKLASAFVTDVGGITSHAAIVAREMRKPCVIGTKIATKVFKDGDLVEVDANKGIVRKIK